MMTHNLKSIVNPHFTFMLDIVTWGAGISILVIFADSYRWSLKYIVLFYCFIYIQHIFFRFI